VHVILQFSKVALLISEDIEVTGGNKGPSSAGHKKCWLSVQPPPRAGVNLSTV
jgi:hypothetical protein